MKFAIFPLLLSLSFTSLQGQQSEVLFDDFQAPDYSISSFAGTGNPDDISSLAVSNETSGGNPGGYSAVTHTLDVARDGAGAPQSGNGSAFLSSIFIQNSMPYDSVADGVIRTIQFQFDVRTADRGSYAFAINSTAALDFTPVAELAQRKGWTTYLSPVYTQSDFAGVDFSGSDPLNFGFRLSTTAEVSNGAETFGYDVDNFRVNVTTVPEPSGLMLLALGTLCAVTRRRRA